MVGGIKPSSPGVKSMSADMLLDLPTMSAPSGEERTPRTSAQVERAGRCCRRSDSGTHTLCGRATVMVLVSSSSGPRVGGCPRAWRYFGPHPVHGYSTVYDEKSYTSRKNVNAEGTTERAPVPGERALKPRVHALARRVPPAPNSPGTRRVHSGPIYEAGRRASTRVCPLTLARSTHHWPANLRPRRQGSRFGVLSRPPPAGRMRAHTVGLIPTCSSPSARLALCLRAVKGGRGESRRAGGGTCSIGAAHRSPAASPSCPASA